MMKLDERNAEAFGDAVHHVLKGMDLTGYALGTLVENIYLKFQAEAERDARDRANGKGEQE